MMERVVVILQVQSERLDFFLLDDLWLADMYLLKAAPLASM